MQRAMLISMYYPNRVRRDAEMIHIGGALTSAGNKRSSSTYMENHFFLAIFFDADDGPDSLCGLG